MKKNLMNYKKYLNFSYTMNKWRKIGEFSVDSGTFMICDPCYMEGAYTRELVEGVEKMIDERKNNISLKFPAGHQGLGVISNTGIGDGIFSVYEKINKDGSKEIRIKFT